MVSKFGLLFLPISGHTAPCRHFRFEDEPSGFNCDGVDELVVGPEDDGDVCDAGETFDHPAGRK